MVKATGCYDEVYSYDELSALSSEGNSSQSCDARYWLLDFAANGTLINDLTKQLGDSLSDVTLIGATDWRQHEWGHEAFLAKYACAWKRFAEKVSDQFYEQSHSGTDAITQLYLETLNGTAQTKALNVVTFD